MENTTAETLQSAGLNIEQNQKAWKFICDANSRNPEQLDHIAI